jgi:hypothetical protein
VLKAPEFQEYREAKVWRDRREQKDRKREQPDLGFWSNLGLFLAEITEALVWIAVAVGIVGLALVLRRWVPVWLEREAKAYRPPDALFGLSLAPESLPDDVAGAADALVRAGRLREALGSLSRRAVGAGASRSRAARRRATPRATACARREDPAGERRRLLRAPRAYLDGRGVRGTVAGRRWRRSAVPRVGAALRRARRSECGHMSRTIVVWIVFLGATALGGVWFFSNYERVSEKQWVGYSGEARHNQYLAAERLLARMGSGAAREDDPELKALPVNGTLILPDRRDALTPDARLALLLWVENGGHLIVEDENSRVPDPILDAFGVTRKPVKSPGKVTPLEVRLPHAPAPMKVEMHSIQSVEAPQAKVRVEGKHATHLAHFDRGRGQVTVVNDLDFLRNRSIGRLDHAEFLWQIVRFQPDTTALFVFDNPQKLSLLRWLADNAWPLAAAAALLLAVWLWRVSSRFGPVAPDPEPARRRLLDHLRASGRFQWSRGGGARSSRPRARPRSGASGARIRTSRA